MNKLAVIGLGNISERHRANLKILYPDAKIFAVSSSGRQPTEKLSNADVLLKDLDDLLINKLDMAIVASPSTSHARHAISLLRAGVPVLIEKPLAACSGDVEAIIAVANETKTPIAVGYCLRYLSSCQEMRRIIHQGDLGVIYNVFVEVGQYLPDWRPNTDYRKTVSANQALGGGALLELSHEFDFLDWLFGELTPHSAILRSSKELSLDVEDSADILAYVANETVISIHLDFLQRKPNRKCRINGSRGSLEWDLLNNQIKINTAEKEYLAFDEKHVDRNQMYIDMLNDFNNKISDRKNQCISLQEAQRTVLLIEKIKNMSLKRSYL